MARSQTGTARLRAIELRHDQGSDGRISSEAILYRRLLKVRGPSVDDPGSVTVEFFGIPRQRAGRADLVVPAGTLSELLQSVEQSCPELTGLRQADGRLSPHYLLSIDGEQFVTDPQQKLRPGDRLLLLAADAGG